MHVVCIMSQHTFCVFTIYLTLILNSLVMKGDYKIQTLFKILFFLNFHYIYWQSMWSTISFVLFVQLNTGWICAILVYKCCRAEVQLITLQVIERKTPAYNINISLIKTHLWQYLQCGCNHPRIMRSERSNHHNSTTLSLASLVFH